MRIVITKNGRILIQEINPDVKYKGLLTKQRSLNKTKFFPKKIKFNEVKKKHMETPQKIYLFLKINQKI